MWDVRAAIDHLIIKTEQKINLQKNRGGLNIKRRVEEKVIACCVYKIS